MLGLSHSVSLGALLYKREFGKKSRHKNEKESTSMGGKIIGFC